MPTNCCVPGCTNKGGHAFPRSDPARMRKWIKMIHKAEDKEWRPWSHTVVCPAHFDDADYIQTTGSGTVPLQRKLKPNAVPHIFAWNTPVPTPSSVSRNERAEKRLQVKEEAEVQRLNALKSVAANVTLVGLPLESDTICAMEKGTQTMYQCLNPALRTTTVETQTSLPWFCVEKFCEDDEAIHFYTGLDNYGKFCLLLSILGPAANELNYYNGSKPSLSVENQLFLTLMKLRQHKTDFELSRFFEISEKVVHSVYVTWINFMSCELSELEIWPSRELVNFYMPKDFQAKFPKTRVILDGVETPVQKPKQPIAQQATFSSYKNRNTSKAVVGATPGGLVSYVSDSYGGATSDRQIVERGSIPQKCDPGDSIMADKGFNVQDLFVTSNVHVNIPTFFRKTNRLSNSVVIEDRKIASKRVHIERIIGLAKTYKILTQPLNNTESSLATKITQLCFFLCNFRSNIVSNDA